AGLARTARVWRGYNSAVPAPRGAHPRLRSPVGGVARTRALAAPCSAGTGHARPRLAGRTARGRRSAGVPACRVPAPTRTVARGGRAAAARLGPAGRAAYVAADQRRGPGGRAGAGSATGGA